MDSKASNSSIVLSSIVMSVASVLRRKQLFSNRDKEILAIRELADKYQVVELLEDLLDETKQFTMWQLKALSDVESMKYALFFQELWKIFLSKMVHRDHRYLDYGPNLKILCEHIPKLVTLQDDVPIDFLVLMNIPSTSHLEVTFELNGLEYCLSDDTSFRTRYYQFKTVLYFVSLPELDIKEEFFGQDIPRLSQIVAQYVKLLTQLPERVILLFTKADLFADKIRRHLFSIETIQDKDIMDDLQGINESVAKPLSGIIRSFFFHFKTQRPDSPFEYHIIDTTNRREICDFLHQVLANNDRKLFVTEALFFKNSSFLNNLTRTLVCKQFCDLNCILSQ